MTPPAWSSWPATDLKNTCTWPSLSDESFLTHQGKLCEGTWPACLSTFGLLGAESSVSTDHLKSPGPVMPATQPAGNSPVLAPSKFTVSALAQRAISAQANTGASLKFMRLR